MNKIKTIKQLCSIIHKLGENKIKQGVYIKELALSIEHHKKERNLEDWKKHTNRILMKGGIIE